MSTLKLREIAADMIRTTAMLGRIEGVGMGVRGSVWLSDYAPQDQPNIVNDFSLLVQ
jgi:hypothetical protein